MEALIVRFGLVMVFAGTALEGDVTMMLAGVTAHLGLFPIATVVAVGALGGFAGDTFFYGLGRWHSETIRRTDLYRRAEPAIGRFTARFGPLQIVVARFVYGTRVASMVFWGVARLPLWRFALIDALGCALWAAALGGLGYTLSGSAVLLLGRVKRVELWLLGALLVCAGLVLLYRAYLQRRGRAVNGSAQGPSGGAGTRG
jgi:membrane protein DedA with SNARE-associated domain